MITTLRLDSKSDSQGRSALPRQAAVIVGGERARIRFDYHLRSSTLGAYVRTDNNDAAASVVVNLPGIGGSVRLESKLLRHVRDLAVGASLDWSEGGLHLHWQPDARGRNCLDLAELALGKLCQEQHTRLTVATELRLPEGNYPCVVSLLDVATWREQAPKATRKEFVAAEVRFAVAPKYPGKGENDYDQGDDFVSESYLPGVGSVGDALANVYGNVMRVREHRASIGWQPKDGAGFVPPRPPVYTHGAEYFPAIETAKRMLGGAVHAAYALNGTGLLVLHVAKKPDESVLEKVQTKLDELCTGINDTTVQHVAIVTAKGRVYGFDEHANLVPFDLDKWPGSPSVFFPAA